MDYSEGENQTISSACESNLLLKRKIQKPGKESKKEKYKVLIKKSKYDMLQPKEDTRVGQIEQLEENTEVEQTKNIDLNKLSDEELLARLQEAEKRSGPFDVDFTSDEEEEYDREEVIGIDCDQELQATLFKGFHEFLEEKL